MQKRIKPGIPNEETKIKQNKIEYNKIEYERIYKKKNKIKERHNKE